MDKRDSGRRRPHESFNLSFIENRVMEHWKTGCFSKQHSHGVSDGFYRGFLEEWEDLEGNGLEKGLDAA
jgi:hypothetical protein